MATTAGPQKALRKKRSVGPLIFQSAAVITALGVILGVVWKVTSLYNDFQELQQEAVAMDRRLEELEAQVRCLESHQIGQQRSRWGMRARSEDLAGAIAEGRPLAEALSDFWDAQLQAECAESGGTVDLSSLSCIGARLCVAP